MEILDSDELILNTVDYKIIDGITKYMKKNQIQFTSQLEKIDLELIANSTNSKLGHVKAIVNTVDLD